MSNTGECSCFGATRTAGGLARLPILDQKRLQHIRSFSHSAQISVLKPPADCSLNLRTYGREAPSSFKLCYDAWRRRYRTEILGNSQKGAKDMSARCDLDGIIGSEFADNGGVWSSYHTVSLRESINRPCAQLLWHGTGLNQRSSNVSRVRQFY